MEAGAPSQSLCELHIGTLLILVRVFSAVCLAAHFFFEKDCIAHVWVFLFVKYLEF